MDGISDGGKKLLKRLASGKASGQLKAVFKSF